MLALTVTYSWSNTPVLCYLFYLFNPCWFYFASKKLLRLPWELDVSENKSEWGGMGWGGPWTLSWGLLPRSGRMGMGLSSVLRQLWAALCPTHTGQLLLQNGQGWLRETRALSSGAANLPTAAAEQLHETPGTAGRKPPSVISAQ